MAQQERGGSSVATVVDSVWIFVTLAGVACALTLVYLGMRSVMNIGGFCAEGGPYEIAVHCPKGSTGFLIGGIWGGLIFAGLYVWRTLRAGVGSFVGLLWPALFLSLGWNFLDFGIINPPGEGGGPVAGWLVCAVLFFIMGGLPLIPALWGIVRWLRGAPPRLPLGMSGLMGSGGGIRTALSTMRQLKQLRRDLVTPGPTTSTWTWPGGGTTPRTPPTGGAAGGADVVAQLERLDALHRSGALSDAQYEAAKRAVLGAGGPA
jgi:hypothetical protein